MRLPTFYEQNLIPNWGKIFYSSIFFIIANPPYLICSNEILSFLLELSHISVENESFIFISVS